MKNSVFFLYESFYNILNYFHSLLWARLEDNIPSRTVAVYRKVSITHLNTFILCCRPSLVMDRPDRPVAVIQRSSFSQTLCLSWKKTKPVMKDYPPPHNSIYLYISIIYIINCLVNTAINNKKMTARSRGVSAYRVQKPMGGNTSQHNAPFLKVSIIYLHTFILGCGPSLVMDKPDRPVAVYKEDYNEPDIINHQRES